MFKFVFDTEIFQTEENTVSAKKEEKKKKLEGNKYQEDTVRVAGVRGSEESEGKIARQAVFV